MDPKPYTNFWGEEPAIQKKAWRPTDESRRRLMRAWLLQAVLLVSILSLAVAITKASQRIPPIHARLPNGILYETSAGPLQMDHIARMALVNDVLQILYFQEGSFNHLNSVAQNVKPGVITQFRSDMQSAGKQTNTTVHLQIAETFEVRNIAAGFEAMTKGELVKRSSKESVAAPIYVRTRWLKLSDRYQLSRIEEVRPGDYYELFLAEKERLRALPREELQRELDATSSQEIQLPTRNPLF